MGSGSVVTVLHLSDLQFGARHRFGGEGLAAGDRRRSTLVARLLDDLAHLKDKLGLRADLVIASGDLAEQARLTEFEQVHGFPRGTVGRAGPGPGPGDDGPG